MALMKFKRSAVPAKIPSVGDLVLGELAINTYDGKVYTKKDDGTQSIVEVGADGAGTVTSVSGTGSVSGLTLTGTVTTSGSLTLGGTLSLTSTNVTDALGYTPATAAQGTKADTAVQTIASADGSVTITGTTEIDLSVAVAGSTTNVLLPIRNNTGATLTKGTAVYISGATGQLSTVSKALATSDATSAQTLGLVTANISNNSNGNVTLIGTITNINTSAYTDGAQLYLSPTTAGTLTATKPHAPQHLVYVAIVEHAHPTQGKLFVKVQNGYEMDELHDVAAQNPSNGQTIVYNSTNGLWEKNTVSLAIGVNGTLPVANGGTGATTLTGYIKGSGTSAMTASAAIPVADVTGAAPLDSPTFTGTITAATADLLGSVRGSVTTVAASAINCSSGNYFIKTASGALTWTATNVPASRSYSFILELTNGGTGTQTWFSGIKWPSGTAPSLTASGVDVLGFITDDGGTTWRGVQLMKDSK